MSTRKDNGTCIYMTRGDTPTLKFDPPFTPAAGSRLIFRLKKSPYDADMLIERDLTSKQITLAVADTDSLEFGDYFYSVEYVNGNYHETLVEPTIEQGLFHVGEENENHGV